MSIRFIVKTLLLVFLLYACKNDRHPDIHTMMSEDFLARSRAIQDSLLINENAEGLSKLYSENAVCLFVDLDEVYGRDNIENMYDNIFDDLDSITIKTAVNELMSEDYWAIERASFTMSFLVEGIPNRQYRTGRVVTMFRKNKGKWQIYWQISNTSPVKDLIE